MRQLLKKGRIDAPETQRRHAQLSPRPMRLHKRSCDPPNEEETTGNHPNGVIFLPLHSQCAPTGVSPVQPAAAP